MISGTMIRNGRLESNLEFQIRVLKDFVTAKETIERELGTKVITLAYPYGHYSEDTIQLAKKAGYKLALTVKAGVAEKGDDPFTLNRITASGQYSGKKLLEIISRYE